MPDVGRYSHRFRFDVSERPNESIPESDAFYTLLGRTSPDLGRLPPDGRKWPFQYQQSNKDVIFTANAQAVEITKFAAFVNTLVSVPITPEQSARHARRSRPASARGFLAYAPPAEMSLRALSAYNAETVESCHRIHSSFLAAHGSNLVVKKHCQVWLQLQ